MAKKIKDACVKTSEYTGGDGKKKGRYMNVGALMQADDGNMFLMINRAVNFAGFPHKEGSESVLVSLYDPKGHDSQQQPSSPAQTEENIPF